MSLSNRFIIEDKEGNKYYPYSFAEVVYTNDGSNVEQKLSEINSRLGDINITWQAIENKPSTFPPSSHTHTASEVGALASNGTAVNASKVANALTISLNGASQGAYNGSAVKNINITAASVGALASNGTATNASRVANNLTLQIAGTTKNTFNGSSAQTFNIPNASTSAPGVMTTAMVSKLNGIATGATNNTVDTAMSSTSTNAVQNKVIYAYIQEQLKNAGDYVGKTMVNISTGSVENTDGYTYTNAKGGFADLILMTEYGYYRTFSLIVDGVTIVSNKPPSDYLKKIDTTDSWIYFELKIPFTSTFTIKYDSDEDDSFLRGFVYLNK